MTAAKQNLQWGRLILDELYRAGVTFACLSPGSRCTPLTAAVALHSGFETVVHHDERGAAFCALGHARADGRPALVVSTSGTAAANYLPAVIEAATDRTPMLLMTADRPPELRDTGANQTIDQVKIFGDYVRWYFELPCPTADIDPSVIRTTIDQALYRTCRSPAGPVHLNCLFREPFLPDDPSSVSTGRPGSSAAGSEGCAPARAAQVGAPHTRWIPPVAEPPESALSEMAAAIGSASSGLVVVGALRSREARNGVLALGQSLGWPVFADITSGLRLGTVQTPVVHYYDQMLAANVLADTWEPGVILQIGGRITSKRLMAFLAKGDADVYYQVSDHPVRDDPGHRRGIRLECGITEFCDALRDRLDTREPSELLDHLQRCSASVDDVIESVLSRTDSVSEPTAARLVAKFIPGNHGLFLANSMPIRDMDMFACGDGARAAVAANRGASGIDGLIASATGFARGLGQPVTLLIGDLAVLHDLSSLAMINATTQPLTIVVINNDGGGIFSFLPVARHEEFFERYFGTPHGLSFQDAAAMFGIAYSAPQTTDEFSSTYRAAASGDASMIIEVKTDRSENAELHQQLQREIVNRIDDERVSS